MEDAGGNSGTGTGTEADAAADDLLRPVRERGGASQLCVLHRGRVVVDEAVNCRPDALFWTFSAGKPLTALVVHALAERGALALNDPVAAHWPEFGANGKEAVTVRQVLSHRAGLPVVGTPLRDALRMADWDGAVRAVERAAPRFPPGEVPAYHLLTFGTILGELARRVTGTPVDELMREVLLEPLGLEDGIRLGVPSALHRRSVPLRVPDRGARGRAAAVWLNRRRLRRAVIPAAGVSAGARELAALYQALLGGGALEGVRVLRPETVAEARRPSTAPGELDRFFDFPVRWAHGFQLGAPSDDSRHTPVLGRTASPLAFGHNGSNCCIAWADPTRELVFVHLTDCFGGRAGRRYLSGLADAALTRFGNGGPGCE